MTHEGRLVDNTHRLEAMYACLLSDDLAGEDRVIGSFTVPSRRMGKDLSALEQASFRDGKVIELQVFYFDPSAMWNPRRQECISKVNWKAMLVYS